MKQNNKYTFEPIAYSELNREEYNAFPNKSVLTTPEWIDFIVDISGASPLILKVYKKSEFIGYFTALKFKKFGITIVGSPFPGWSTPYMGFDFYDKSLKSEVVPELVEYIYKTQKCQFFQLTDRDITFEEAEQLKQKYGYIIDTAETLELRVDADDKQMYKNMKTDCRNFINQFERRGATIEFATPDDAFAEEYYTQLLDVFAKQNLVPTHGVDLIKKMLKHLSVANNILCLRIRDPEGLSIATSIYPGFNKKFFFMMGASLRPYQQYRPNEYMIYTAMKYWRDRGCEEFDMVGIRPYKKKFGSWEERYPIIIAPKYKILYHLKNIASSLYYWMGSMKWKVKHLFHK